MIKTFAKSTKIGCGENMRCWHNKECNLDCGTPDPIYKGKYFLCERCEKSTKGVKENES